MLKAAIILSLFFAQPLLCQAQHSAAIARLVPITLGVTETMHSAVLGEDRTLNIYLPEGYSPDDTTHYPVIYLLDGGVDEDFVHVAGLVQFSSQPWVARLQRSIVVGIGNTDRKRDMTFPAAIKSDKDKLPTSGGSAKFISFLEQELQPYVQKHYKTNNSKTLIGESLAGLLAVQVLLEKPALFSRYIIISPSLWWNDGSLLKHAMAPVTGKTSIYLAAGKEGLAPCDAPHVMEVDANVLADKIESLNNKQVSFYFDYLPEETHATIAHQALMNAFRFFSR